MKIWAITFDPSTVKNQTFDDLYTKCLDLVDLESKEKIKKYFHRVDAFRSLIGKLLPRMVLREQGLSNGVMSFAKTKANKPYINIASTRNYHLLRYPVSNTSDSLFNEQPISLLLPEPIGFNVTHDGGVVAMAFEIGTNQPWNDPPAHRIGVDIMKLGIPDRFTFQSFVNTVGDALTTFEKASLNPNPPVAESQSLHHFFLIWTLKEAYTKALGLGLGFDFKRIEYDNTENCVRVDGVVLKGWEFDVFQLPTDQGEPGGYIGVGSKYVGGDQEAIVKQGTETTNLVQQFGAEEFLGRVLRELGR